MKKCVLILFLLLASASYVSSQNLSRRAKADRLLQIADSRMQIREVKVQFDTLIVLSQSESLFYPFGKYLSVNDFVQKSKIEWYRASERYDFQDSLSITVYQFARLDESFFNVYQSVNTGYLEFVNGLITDKALVLTNGIHVGMSKSDLLAMFFKNPPMAYVEDIRVLKVYSSLYEVSQIFTFDEDVLVQINLASNYQYY